MSTGLCLSRVRYVPFGVSSPGRPVLIAQRSMSRPSRYRYRRCVRVLATAISDLPTVKLWVRV
jgi:hypothetical protein